VPLIPLGRIARPHGLKGEVALGGTPLDARELRAIRRFMWRGRDGSERPLTLLEARGAPGRVIARFEGIAQLEAAEGLRGGWLLADSSRLPDPGPGMAYRFQLIGFEVVSEEGRPLGQLVEIWGTGAHDVLVVRGASEILVPSVPEFVKSVDMSAQRIVVKVLPGMESAEPAAERPDERDEGP
jgi:16S rRNA processing protein RimM